MALKALIFDLDGTLTDTNEPHAVAWQHSFADGGFSVSTEQINSEIGKGGDHFVASILGEEADEKHGDALREGHTRHYLQAINSTSVSIIEGGKELVEHAKNLGLKVALASSSQNEELEAVEKSSGVQWRELFDVVVTSSDVKESKPSPDLVVVAVEKLGVSPAECAFVGDTIFDAQACSKAGVTMLGVRTGPNSVSSNERLMEAGARQTYRNAADLLAHFEAATRLD